MANRGVDTGLCAQPIEALLTTRSQKLRNYGA